jgi:hypothetical protein
MGATRRELQIIGHRDRIPQIRHIAAIGLDLQIRVGHHADRRHSNNSCHISSSIRINSLLLEWFSAGTEWVWCLC